MTGRTFAVLVAWLLVARAIFLGAGVYASTVFPQSTRSTDTYVNVALPPLAQIVSTVRELHRSADEGWYRSVAENGYTKRPFDLSKQENWSMFPLLPIIWSLLGLSGTLLIGLIYIANLCSLYLLYRICIDVLKLDEKHATLACLCLIFWPFSYQNFVTRAEPLLLTLTLAAFYFYWTATGWRRFSVVLLSVFLATAAKPNGFVTGLALMATEGLLQLRDKRYEWSDSTLWLRGVLLAVATFAPLALLSLHMGLYTGEPLAWVHIQKTWAVSAEFSFASIITAYFPQAMVGRWGWDATIFNAVVLVVTLWILIYFTATRRRDPHYWPLIIESAIIQIVSGALFFGYVFNRHSLPIVLNYLGAGISARTARAVVVLGAGFQGMAGALAALRVIHILA